ncbi:MAG: divergent PAP2 family protein [Clostridia bacterium]|nr:divergent PAP2 family protein [Clostridia bacterium]
MGFFLEQCKNFFSNYLLMSAICAWLIAQLAKVARALWHRESCNYFALLFSSGGMPSSHSACVMSLCTACGIQYGVNSALFAICGILAAVVMIDASGVRYETGKQSKLLNRIAREFFDGDDPELLNTSLKELVGHTPFQVFVGAMLGIAIGIVMYFVMK